MKKTYIEPTVSILTMEFQSMIAASIKSVKNVDQEDYDKDTNPTNVNDRTEENSPTPGEHTQGPGISRSKGMIWDEW